jgi:hypothetical protein
VPAPAGHRDNEFDEAAYKRLLKAHLAVRRYGSSPARLIAIANLELHLGNLEQAKAAVGDLVETHPEEAEAIRLQIAQLEHAPLRERRSS